MKKNSRASVDGSGGETARRRMMKVAATAKTVKGGDKDRGGEEIAPLEVLNAVPCFFLKQAETIVIKRGSFSHLSLVFIPILFETQKCYVIFSDPAVGEFQHEIVGSVTLPEEIVAIPEAPITPPIYVDEQRNWTLKIPFKNDALREARKNIEYFIQ